MNNCLMAVLSLLQGQTSFSSKMMLYFHSADDNGVITNTAWNVMDLEAAISLLSAAKDVLVVRVSNNGCFFPGSLVSFVGDAHTPSLFSLRRRKDFFLAALSSYRR
jgi:hypothetical protein